MDNREYVREYVKAIPAKYKQIVGNTAWVLLLAYTALITMASFSTKDFWDVDNDFFPFTGAKWYSHWTIEEYLFYILLPWMVVYYIKKGQRSD